MTHSHSGVHAQLDALLTADPQAMFAELVRAGLQALIEAEAAATIGADRYERAEGRTTHRNGHRAKTVSTPIGDIEAQIPKLRSGSFFPALLERRRRFDRALYAVIMQAYVHGVSTRAVDDLVRALGDDTGISKSEISRICADDVEQFRTRTLSHTQFPYVVADAAFCKVRSVRTWSATPWTWPPGSPSTAPAKCSARRSGTVSRTSSGMTSCAP